MKIRSLLAALACPAVASAAEFRAGAAAVDITPPKLPAIIAGGFLEKTGTTIHDRLYVRTLVLDDGQTRIAFAIVDTCMMPRTLIDAAKAEASARCGIPGDRMMVSATHTHSAPAAMGCLGTRVDRAYAEWLPGRIAEAIASAAAKLQPARIGWASIDDWEHTHNRRWIRHPEKKIVDPFGAATGLAHMHPGYLSADVIGPSGPVDPELSVLSVQTRDGRPLAVLANYSQHYFGAPAVSADYYGSFCRELTRRLGLAGEGHGDFVCAMSQGTSGDLMWMDYGAPKKTFTTESYAAAVAEVAHRAVQSVQYRDHAPLGMVEKTLTLRYRVPDEKRLAWARPLAARIENELPKNREEVYAQEALILHERQQSELRLQAIRIGDLSIATLPNEVYAITGLQLKAQTPARAHFNIELANGADGYIPPPEQHVLGGYTTWPARTAGLEVQAEPKIVATLLDALEEVTGEKRRPVRDEHGPYAQAVLAAKPAAYWRLNEWAGQTAANSVTGGAAATLADGFAWYLPGAGSGSGTGAGEQLAPSAFSGPRQINRAVHLAGGHLDAAVADLHGPYSVALWFWLGEPSGASERAGALLKAPDGTQLVARQGKDHRVALSLGEQSTAANWRADEWHCAVVTQDGKTLRLHLDGAEAPALSVASGPAFTPGTWRFGEGLQGKIDEIAVFPRALSSGEIVNLWKTAAIAPTRPAPAPTAASTAADSTPAMASQPLAPEASRRKIHVPPGMRAHLVAAEPQVLDPVAFDWDERGRLWVVEMADYPLGMDNEGQPGGRIRVLEDVDGDGRYERSTLFAEGLNFPNGILTWRDGVLVTAAPDILFLRDTDGDGRADERTVLVTGLQEGNQQLRANGLRWGLDNWVYLAIGGHHGKYGVNTRLKSLRTGQEILVGSRDFRFRPDTGELEPQSGPTQFGRNRDNWGRWFGTQNSHPLWHYVLPDHYLRRNPHFAATATLVQLVTPANPPVFPASAPEKRFHSFTQSGHFTSACAGMIYRDTRLFADGTHAFVCEPFHNLVQHVELAEKGVTFSARRLAGDQEHDFLASEDRWFRPVMMREGPDGALWVADMYRYMIEHPQFLPAEGKAELLPHYRAGDDRGRIYRIDRDVPAAKPAPLHRLNSAELATALDSSNGWQRDKVHQMLLWRADSAAIAPLRALAARSSHPLARLHALCVLDGLRALEPGEVARALADEHPGVRENALRLAESFDTPAVLTAALALADDPDPKVRLQLAFSLGAWDHPDAGSALARLLEQDGGEPMCVAAAMSSSPAHLSTLVAKETHPGLREMLLTTALGLRDRAALAALLRPTFTATDGHFSADQLAAYAQLLDQLARSGITLAELRGTADPLHTLLGAADAMFAQVRTTAKDGRAPALARVTAAALLSRDPTSRPEALTLLLAWLSHEHPSDAQKAAIGALATVADPSIPAAFAERWPALLPSSREAMLDAWMSREPWAHDLLQRLSMRELPPSAIDTVRRGRLLKHDSTRVSKLAAKIFEGSGTARAEILQRYQPALALPGDAQRGHQVFLTGCASCHRRAGEGRDLGPDLASVVEHAPEKLLGSILDPNADVQPGFSACTCTLQSGEQLYGLVSAETETSVTLKLPDGTLRPVLRTQIRSLQNQSLSLMPEGLEAVITPQQMADLLTFLRSPLAPADPVRR